MIDFKIVGEGNLEKLRKITRENVERSELSMLPLFTLDLLEKTKIFIFCFRFLNTIYNVLSEGEEIKEEESIKKQIKAELELARDKYKILYLCKIRIEENHYDNYTYIEQMNNAILADTIVDDMIDAFAILLEKTTLLSIENIQGFILEGKSKEEYEKLTREKVKVGGAEEIEEPELEEDYVSENIEEKEGAEEEHDDTAEESTEDSDNSKENKLEKEE